MLICLTMVPNSVVASTDIIIDATNFPDEAFNYYLVCQSYGSDGILTEDEIASISQIDVSNYGIKSLKGIEYFTALTDLSCPYNQLSTLDVSKNTELAVLNCTGNKLINLEVSNLTKLKYLNCSGNRFTSLDVSKNTLLTGLFCAGNDLSTLDVSKNTLLYYLYCHLNKLTSLDLSKNTQLKELKIYVNNISGANMDALIESLPTTVEGGRLYAIDTRNEMEANVCTKQQVTMAKQKGWKVYNDIFVYEGSEPDVEDIAIDATNFPDEVFRNYLLSQSYGSDGKLTQAEIASVTWMSISSDPRLGMGTYVHSLTGIEFFTALDALYLYDQSELEALDVSQNTLLETLWCEKANLSILHLPDNIKTLYCNGNQLTSLNVSKNALLESLDCSNNKLTSLDVSKNTALTFLSCSNNQLTSLNVSKNTALTSLYCYGNQLSSLDVSKNTALTKLECNGNNLMSIDISKNTLLTWFRCNGNKLTSLDLSKNKSLHDVYCFENHIKGASMDALVASLPTGDGSNTIWVISAAITRENNVCTKSQVSTLKQKGWKVYTYLGTDEDGGTWYYQEYSGSDDGPQVGDIFTAQMEGVTMTFKVTSVEPMMCQVGNGIDAAISTAQTGVVTIPAEANGCKVTSIGSNAFKGCKLKECVIPATVTSVSSGAFSNCGNLEEITSEATTPFDIADSAFDGEICALTILSVPDEALAAYKTASVGQKFTRVQSKTVQTNHGVGYMFLDRINQDMQVNRNMQMGFEVTDAVQKTAKVYGNGLLASVFANVAVEVRIPEEAKGYTITEIGNRAFFNCKKLTKVWSTKNIKKIGDEVFYGCTNLPTFDLPVEVEYISENAFVGCNDNMIVRYHPGQEQLLPAPPSSGGSGGWTYDIVPNTKDDVEYIDTKRIFITEWMTALGRRSYSYCPSVVEIVVDPNNEVYDSRENCNAIIRTADNVLLYGCQNTKIPYSVTGIDDYAFEGHDRLKKISLPSGLTSIGNWAFADVNLTEVESAISELFPINDNTFSVLTYNTAKLYVRMGMKEIYKQTPGWRLFQNIEEKVFDDPITVTAVNIEREYGEWYPEPTYTIEGGMPLGGVPEIICEATMESPVGTYPIIVSRGTLENADVTFVNGTLTITKAPLEIMACDYRMTEGDNLPEFECVYHGLKVVDNSEILNANPVFTTTATSESAPGQYEIVVSGVESENYEITYVSGTLYIDARTPIADLMPVGEDVEGGSTNATGTDFGDENSEVDEDSNLYGNIVGNIYYNIKNGDGGYSAAEGCIAITKPTDDEDISDDDEIFGEGFTGIIFKVPAGSGIITVTAETTGNMTLKVKIGNLPPIEMEIDGKLKTSFPYNVAVPSYVRICGGANAASVKVTRSSEPEAAGVLKIYSIEWDTAEDGIRSIESENENNVIYNLAGQRLTKLQRGVNIIGGRKVVVRR